MQIKRIPGPQILLFGQSAEVPEKLRPTMHLFINVCNLGCRSSFPQKIDKLFQLEPKQKGRWPLAGGHDPALARSGAPCGSECEQTRMLALAHGRSWGSCGSLAFPEASYLFPATPRGAGSTGVSAPTRPPAHWRLRCMRPRRQSGGLRGAGAPGGEARKARECVDMLM